MATSDFLRPFVLPVTPVEPERSGTVDLYLPASSSPRPAIVFVHGGPLPAELTPRPREWPMFRGYGSLAAAHGCVGATVDHRLHHPGAYPAAASDVTAAVAQVRADPRVDPSRTAIWFFSGGGPLLADWLRTPAPGVRCLAASFPLLAEFPGFPLAPRFRPVEAVDSWSRPGAADSRRRPAEAADSRFRPAEAADPWPRPAEAADPSPRPAEAADSPLRPAEGPSGSAMSVGSTPVVLTRVGLEDRAIAAGVDAFIDAGRTAGAPLTVIDVPHGHHSFDTADDTDESREAINRAFDAVLAHLDDQASRTQTA